MNAPAEFLVISRGKWDPHLPPEKIQTAIDEFYTWISRMVDEGKMRTGYRLGTEGKTVGRNNMITDGPYGETKEVVGGYWFILAKDLDEAAAWAAQNPCLQCGIVTEIRPLDPEKASAYARTNETPE